MPWPEMAAASAGALVANPLKNLAIYTQCHGKKPSAPFGSKLAFRFVLPSAALSAANQFVFRSITRVVADKMQGSTESTQTVVSTAVGVSAMALFNMPFNTILTRARTESQFMGYDPLLKAMRQRAGSWGPALYPCTIPIALLETKYWLTFDLTRKYLNDAVDKLAEEKGKQVKPALYGINGGIASFIAGIISTPAATAKTVMIAPHHGLYPELFPNCKHPAPGNSIKQTFRFFSSTIKNHGFPRLMRAAMPNAASLFIGGATFNFVVQMLRDTQADSRDEDNKPQPKKALP